MTGARFIRVRWALLFAAGLLAFATPVFGRITRTRPSASTTAPGAKPSLLTPFYSLIIGGGVDYQSDDEQTEWGFPILIEYNFSEQIKLTIEPKFSIIRGKKRDVRSVSGFWASDTEIASFANAIVSAQ